MLKFTASQNGGTTLTICIAALYKDGNGCILASDQMTTAHFPIGYEFESEEVGKIVKIIENVHVLISGDVLFANQVIEEAKREIGDDTNKSIAEFAEIVRRSYVKERMTRLAHTVLEPRGLNLQSYFNLQQRLAMPVVQLIDRAFVEWKTRVELIVVGKDGSGCHIYTIQNPGTLACHNPVGFAAIGTGGPHAVYTLIELKYKKSLSKEQVEKLVKNAKTRSEVAPGVGKETTIISIE